MPIISGPWVLPKSIFKPENARHTWNSICWLLVILNLKILAHCRKQNDGRNIENYRSGSKVKILLLNGTAFLDLYCGVYNVYQTMTNMNKSTLKSNCRTNFWVIVTQFDGLFLLSNHLYYNYLKQLNFLKYFESNLLNFIAQTTSSTLKELQPTLFNLKFQIENFKIN